MRAVIIEDEKRARAALSSLLEKMEPPVQVVGESDDASEGLQIISERLPDLVIADIRMPGMSGLEMIRILREKEIDTEFVIVSGYSDFKYAQEAISLGVIGYILKPVTYEDIEQIIRKIEKKNKNTNLELEIKKKLPQMKIQELEEQCSNLVTKRAIRYVSNNIGNSCRLAATAMELKVSPEHLSRVFHEDMGMTFTEYVKLVKMDYSMVLLRKTDMKVLEISRAIGMENEKYFSSVFKEIVGVTPKQYRLYSNQKME